MGWLLHSLAGWLTLQLGGYHNPMTGGLALVGGPLRRYQENVGAWATVVLNAPGPPRGVVVAMVHLVHSDPF